MKEEFEKEKKELILRILFDRILFGRHGEMTELADCGGLENRCARKGTQGSNPCLSAKRKRRSLCERLFLLMCGDLKPKRA